MNHFEQYPLVLTEEEARMDNGITNPFYQAAEVIPEQSVAQPELPVNQPEQPVNQPKVVITMTLTLE